MPSDKTMGEINRKRLERHSCHRIEVQAAQSRTPCKYFAKGSCKYGASCRYLHEVSLRPQDSVGPRRSGGKGDGKGTGNPNHADHSGGTDARKFRTEIANQNYAWQARWFLSATVSVSWTDCMNWQDQVAPKRCTTEVTFSDRTTADALQFFAKKFGSVSASKVCGMNFANGSTVGGGYLKGALAQEEDLCRRLPMLYSTLNNASKAGLFPFGPSTYKSKGNVGKYSDVLFTPNVVIARRSEQSRFELLPPHEQLGVSLVTAAAPNLNKNQKEVKDLELMYRTVQSVLVAPLMREPRTEVLILGAWGCGAFGGNPDEVG
mmetsp:Transcript_62104/g.202683  ORF Transcript_62104/g.202683 Transcript_62104/m.202683 type:complete len:319 (+) Transcript_62104:147-1103(+)